MMDKKIGRGAEYDNFCSDCGFPIRKDQIGTIIEDACLADFNERIYVDLSIVICSECFERIKANVRGGMEKAIKQKAGLNRL